jgi:hypothetical protein
MAIYKICEELNGHGESRYNVKIMHHWYWPFWEEFVRWKRHSGLLFPEFEVVYYETYEQALKEVNKLKNIENDQKMRKFKIKKCKIVKDNV